MKRAIVAVVSAIALAGAGAPNAAPSDSGTATASQGPVEIGNSQNGETVELAVGGLLVVSLPANPTTGAAWFLVDMPETLQLGAKTYVRTPVPATAVPTVGGGGTERLTFQADSEGTGRLRLEYRRARPVDAPPARVFEIDVSVE